MDYRSHREIFVSSVAFTVGCSKVHHNINTSAPGDAHHDGSHTLGAIASQCTLVAIAFVAVFALVGFFVLPSIAKAKFEPCHA
jgi:hypothetical protein